MSGLTLTRTMVDAEYGEIADSSNRILAEYIANVEAAIKALTVYEPEIADKARYSFNYIKRRVKA